MPDLGDSMRKGLKQACVMKAKHRQLADDATALHLPAEIAAWKSMIAAWDQNHDNFDPYEEPESGKFPRFLKYSRK